MLTRISRRRLLSLACAGVAAYALPVHANMLLRRPPVQVFKTPDCGCCHPWMAHLQQHGYAVTATDLPNTRPIRQRHGLPERLASCHTAVVGGYVIEGHVPAQDIDRLLAARPRALGLAVPGMVVGSPGMEVGDRVDPYEVLLVSTTGTTTVFNRYPEVS